MTVYGGVMKSERLTIRLDAEVAIEVRRIAAAEHLTQAAVISRALWAALKLNTAKAEDIP